MNFPENGRFKIQNIITAGNCGINGIAILKHITIFFKKHEISTSSLLFYGIIVNMVLKKLYLALGP